MLRLMIYLAAISGVIFIFLSVFSYSGKSQENGGTDVSPRRAYFWGLMFSVFFYYGFPIWWWRYGLRNAFYLMFSCVATVMLIQYMLRSAELIEVDGLGESMAVGLLIAVPVRAFAGLWVVYNDARLRDEIIMERKARAKTPTT